MIATTTLITSDERQLAGLNVYFSEFAAWQPDGNRFGVSRRGRNAENCAGGRLRYSLTIVGNQDTPLTLTMDATVATVTVSGSATLTAGATETLTAAAKDAAGDTVLVGPSALTWSSSDTGKATIDAATGIATGVGAGPRRRLPRLISRGRHDACNRNVCAHGWRGERRGRMFISLIPMTTGS